MPDYLEYHRSTTDELHALKNRIRDLTIHWPSDGEYKEAALRTILKRHLPASMIVGRGFIVTENDSSTQIDVLIVDGNKPTLFHDSDLLFVTPDCVRAVIEVKTSLDNSKDFEECALKLAEIGWKCRNSGSDVPWLGIFSYEAKLQNNGLLFDGLERAFRETDVPINCLAYGKDRFIRYWSEGELEAGDNPIEADRSRWRAYRLNHLASSYFVGNVVDSISNLDRSNNAYAWYPLSHGKRKFMQSERIIQPKP